MRNCGNQSYIYNENNEEVAFMQYVDKFYDKSFRLEILGEVVTSSLPTNAEIHQPLIKTSMFNVLKQFISFRISIMFASVKNLINRIIIHYF
jgi:hypothetical protein